MPARQGAKHSSSVRHLPELMGSARSTVEESNRRLQEQGYLRLIRPGSGELGSTWILRLPDSSKDAFPGHPLPPLPAVGGCPENALLSQVMADDAFHHFAHGPTGARVLGTLDSVEGLSAREIAGRLGLHPSC